MLPLPNLDTRRWADLVDEGRALIPRFAPTWTDHNVHDPGITLIELFAYMVEGLMYRANRIPERHLWKFLALAGFEPRRPRPATAVLRAQVQGASAQLDLPRGTVFETQTAQGTLQVQATGPVSLYQAELDAVQAFDGTTFADCTRPAGSLVPFPAFGVNPGAATTDSAASPALYLGFRRPLSPAVPVTLYFDFGAMLDDELPRLREEAAADAQSCRPAPPAVPCRKCPPTDDLWCGDAAVDDSSSPPTGAPAETGIPTHHSVRVTWEYQALDGWKELRADPLESRDHTRSFTLDGTVQIHVPGPMKPTQVGVVDTPLHYVRCRLARGSWDAPPMLTGPIFNAVLVQQQSPAWQILTIDPGAVVVSPTIGAPQPLQLELRRFGSDIRVTRVEPGPNDGRPDVVVLDFVAPAGGAPGSLTLAAELALVGTGLPDQIARLQGPQVANGTIDVWSAEASWLRWEFRSDFAASGPLSRHYTLDAVNGMLRFGNGAHGRVVPQGVPVFVVYAATVAGAGNLRADYAWSVADSPWNRALLGASGSSVGAANTALRTLRNPLAAWGGADQEDLRTVQSRAVDQLWAHERLVDLAPDAEPPTLDQLDRGDVLGRAAPRRATTLLDFERLALEIPGTRVRRARAWANLDPAYPSLQAAGTVSLVVVPALPAGRPVPSPALLATVRRYLDRRRVLCTRLVVTGPTYVTVVVRARVRTLRGADSARVENDVLSALGWFLDPLDGGPLDRGWPFGRDVYRSEILATIDAVAGVDYVIDCTLIADGREIPCGNVCLEPTWLVASGDHEIAVVRS